MIKFDSWQELAKYVIDGGEVYYGLVKRLYLTMTIHNSIINSQNT